MPFTKDEFLNIFVKYNESVYPLQFILLALALYSIYLVTRKQKYADQLVSGILGFYWLWIGVYYHLILFTAINKAAYAFGVIYLLQGIFFIYEGIIKNRLRFKIDKSIYSYLGLIFILYAIVIYPLLGTYFGHDYPANPTFGLPCPTTIFTFGLLLFLNRKFPYYIISIPFIWALVGTMAALRLSIYEDYGLLVAGLLGFLLLIMKNRKMKSEEGN